MGLLSGLLGNAAEVDVSDIDKDLSHLIIDGEQKEFKKGTHLTSVQKALASCVLNRSSK